MLPFLCEGDAAISSAGLIAEVDAGHAIAPTPTVGLFVLPTGQQGKRF
jgi:hypothetical protein